MLAAVNREVNVQSVLTAGVGARGARCARFAVRAVRAVRGVGKTLESSRLVDFFISTK